MTGEVVRFIVVFSCFICACEAVAFCIVYYRTVIPMKERLQADGGILAPPIWWVFWYHVVVGVMCTTIGVGIVINISWGVRVNPTTYALAIVVPCLVVIKKQFLAYYLRLLNHQQSLRQPPNSF